jgi:hypothetical protein
MLKPSGTMAKASLPSVVLLMNISRRESVRPWIILHCPWD